MRNRLSLLILVLTLLIPFTSVAAQTATPSPTPGLDVFCGTPAPTWTPAPSSTPTPTYSDIVLSLNPIAYWKLDDTSGSVATDYSGNGFHGMYSGATLAGDTFLNGDPAATFDGVNDLVNVYSSGLASDFNPHEFTLVFPFRVSASIWTDGIHRVLGQFYANSTTYTQMHRPNPSNRIDAVFRSGAIKTASASGLTSTNWMIAAMTVSESDDYLKLYINGSQTGSVNSLPAWPGDTISAANIARSTTGGNYWSGSIAHVAVFDYALSPAQITSISTMPGAPLPTPTPVFTPTPYPECVVLDPEYYWTVVPPNGTPGIGQAVRFSYEMTAGDVGVGIVLAGLVFTIAVVLALALLPRKSERKQ